MTCSGHIPNVVLMTFLYWGVRLTWAASSLPFITLTVQEPGQDHPHYFLIRQGVYGLNSPLLEVRGQVLAPQPLRGTLNLQGCDPETHFQVPPDLKQWIALLQRGNCTFKEKISRAAFHHAIAAVIYNSKPEMINMVHEGTGKIVAVMIPESEGNHILSYLEKNASVQMTISNKTSY
uniref:PA domain-containing protein n=1 Tax=Monodelphis domestica TaxID=13616 RepID=A0A5F8HFX9_MONDO